ncbi:hypothetical protein STEG23_009636 [Scotinomys teguina]
MRVGPRSMLAVIQKKKSFNEIFFNYFKKNKMEIAQAIPKLFPFLESLKDHSFITDKIYADAYEACRNLVPVENVVYNVLDHLEKLSGWSFLCTLFNRTNLNAYPGLREIRKNVETELEDMYLSQRSKQDQKLATVKPCYEQALFLYLGTLGMHFGTTIILVCLCGKLQGQQDGVPGTNLHTHETRTQPCFVKQENLQRPGTMQNRDDEVIVISSEDSESSDDDDDEKELLEVFTLTPGVRSQMEEEEGQLYPFHDSKSCTTFRESLDK